MNGTLELREAEQTICWPKHEVRNFSEVSQSSQSNFFVIQLVNLGSNTYNYDNASEQMIS